MVRRFLKFQLTSFLLLMVVVVLVAAVGAVNGKLNAAFFVRALDWTGLICIAMGTIGMLGSWVSRGSFEINFSRSAGTETMDRRSASDARQLLGSFAWLVLWAWTGILQLLVSMLIDRFAR